MRFPRFMPFLRAAASLVVAASYCAVAGAQSACVDAEAAVAPVATLPQTTWLRAYRAEFQSPTRLAADRAGRIYVADPVAGRVLVRNRDGSVHRVRGGLGEPAAIAVDDAGWIYLGDGVTGAVAVFDQNWEKLFELGAGAGEMGRPGDIAVDSASGEVFVSDSARHQVAVFARGPGPRLRSYGGEGGEDGRLRTPTGMTLADGELLVADQLNYRIQVLDKATGAFRRCFGTARNSSFVGASGGPARSFGLIQGLWADASGRLYVADAFQGSVRVLDRQSGRRLGDIAVFGDAPGALRVPTDLAMDDGGRLFVAAANNARIEMFGIDAFSDPERFVPAQASVLPAALDRGAPPDALELLVRIPGYRLADADATSLLLNGLAPDAVSSGDRDADGDPELVLRIATARLLPTLGEGDSGLVSATGQIAGLQFAAQSSVTLSGTAPGDEDGDGVADAADRCRATPAAEPTDAAGCAVSQLCPCAGPAAGGAWRNHGAFMNCVQLAVRQLEATGRLMPPGRAALISANAASRCGR